MHAKQIYALALAISTLSLIVGCGGGDSPDTDPTPSPTPTSSPSPTPTPTPTPTPGPQVPAAPSGLNASTSGTQAQLSWNDNASNETAYVVQDNASNLGWKDIATLPANTRSATVTNLDAGTDYAFRVVATNAVGASAPSNEATVTIAAVTQSGHTLTAPYTPNYVASLTGRYRWNKRNLTYSLSVGPETRSEATLAALVEAGLMRWTTATSGMLTFSRTTDPAAADFKIQFVAQNDPSIAAGGEEGLAEFGYVPGTPRNILDTATISLKADVPSGRLISVVAHEAGHALGISGHSSDDADVMAPTIRASNAVSLRDANSLAFLYLTDEN
jgi:hypothetical protein